MTPVDPRPRLRPEIEAVPTHQQDELLYILHDRLGLSPAQLAVSPVVLFVVSLLDGSHSVLDIQEHFKRETDGGQLSAEQIDSILRSLDDCLFLLGTRFEDHLQQIRREFEAEPVRQPRSAGSAYAADPEALREELGAYIDAAPIPEAPPPADMPSHAPRGVIAPHIDFARGGTAYGQLYRELARRTPPDTVIILGTAHYPMQRHFAVLNKDFILPDGPVRVNPDAAERLAHAGGHAFNQPEDLFAHRAEHSIELQTVWLRHIWGEAVRIVPVLVGSLQPCILGERQIREEREFLDFSRALAGELTRPERTMILASADLAHVGPRFQDQREIDEAFLAEVEKADRAYLRAITDEGPYAAFESICAHGDRYHICGLGSIHALGLSLPGVRGRLLGYHQAVTPETEQAVTFAGIFFE